MNERYLLSFLKFSFFPGVDIVKEICPLFFSDPTFSGSQVSSELKDKPAYIKSLSNRQKYYRLVLKPNLQLGHCLLRPPNFPQPGCSSQDSVCVQDLCPPHMSIKHPFILKPSSSKKNTCSYYSFFLLYPPDSHPSCLSHLQTSFNKNTADEGLMLLTASTLPFLESRKYEL